MLVSVSKVNFSLKIPSISKQNKFESPEFVIQHVPWNIKVYKNTEDAVDWLSVFFVLPTETKA